MKRTLLMLALLAPLGYTQTLPSYRWSLELDASGVDKMAGLGTDAAGNTYVVGSTRSASFSVKSAVQSHSASPGNYDVFVTKLDPAGNIVYSTYFGGGGIDIANAMTVDPAGNVYVTGTTTSTDFPTTQGSYSAALPAPLRPIGFGNFSPVFLFKLNADGSVGYSTYFTSSPTTPNAIAVDNTGSVYLTGSTYGGLVTTPGAYQSVCNCPVEMTIGPTIFLSDGFVTRFNAAGSQLVYSTYLGVENESGGGVLVGSDRGAFIGGSKQIYHFDLTGSTLVASASAQVSTQSMAMAHDGSLYFAGAPAFGTTFQPTAGAFATNPPVFPALPYQISLDNLAGIVKMDAQLQHTLAATYFGGFYGVTVPVMAVDASSNVYVGGYTSPRSLPTLATFAQGFGAGTQSLGPDYAWNGRQTGYLAELSGDLSALLFSSNFGDNEIFGVMGAAVGSNGRVVLGGSTGDGVPSSPANIWLNSLVLTPPPALRIDSVLNAASLLSDPVSSGETVLIKGAGFAADAQLSIGGVTIPAISTTSTAITATVPPNLPSGAVTFQVSSGGAASNEVVVAVAATETSPGLFSADGSGYGQAYIVNKDGTLNAPSNPAAQGDPITIYATGVGPVSFSGSYAVSQYPSNAFIELDYCAGVAASLGPVEGFPGNVYRLTVYVPDIPGYHLPALAGVLLQMNGIPSQNGLSISIAQ